MLALGGGGAASGSGQAKGFPDTVVVCLFCFGFLVVAVLLLKLKEIPHQKECFTSF